MSSSQSGLCFSVWIFFFLYFVSFFLDIFYFDFMLKCFSNFVFVYCFFFLELLLHILFQDVSVYDVVAHWFFIGKYAFQTDFILNFNVCIDRVKYSFLYGMVHCLGSCHPNFKTKCPRGQTHSYIFNSFHAIHLEIVSVFPHIWFAYIHL